VPISGCEKTALAHVLAEAREDFLAAVDQGHLHAQAMEDVGELDGDVAAAGDQDGARQLRQVERLVGGNAQFVAGQRCMWVGRTARGDDDPIGGDGLARLHQADGVRIDQLRAAFDDLRAAVFEAAAVQAFEPGDFPVLGGDQRLPVERGLADLPPVADRILEMLAVMRGIDEELLGHAAADDAGAAEPVLFGNRHPLAERGGPPAPRRSLPRSRTGHSHKRSWRLP
jgi:hypothetical protein